MEVPHLNYTLPHLLSIPVIVYVADSNDWVRYHQVHSVHDDLTQKSMYITHNSSQIDIVLSIQ